MEQIQRWAYSRKQIDRAGEILADSKSSEDEKNEALKIIDYWRAIHSYPMHIFRKRLRTFARKIDKGSLTVQRLKRLPAITKKLRRSYNDQKPSMKLSRMQDIGGCRAVLADIRLVKRLHEESFVKGDLKHKKVNQKDYISFPKPDGYRGIHLIYKYYSDKGKTEYNDLLIEIQLRSRLQHLWATAVETVDLFTHQAIKSNEGKQEWKDFFRLVSSAFAKVEHCPGVINTPEDTQELYRLIKEKAEELQVIKKMQHWAAIIDVIDKVKNKKDVGFFLLELDTQKEKLKVTPYGKSEEQKALLAYVEAEKSGRDKKGYDVVLIGANTNSELKKGYPNYFVDTAGFLTCLELIIEKVK